MFSLSISSFCFYGNTRYTVYLIIFQVKRITNLQCIRTGPYGFPGTRVDVIPAGARMSSTWCKCKLLGFHTGTWQSSTHRRGSWHDPLYWGMTTVHLNRGMNLCDAALPSSMTVIHLLAVLIVVMPFIIMLIIYITKVWTEMIPCTGLAAAPPLWSLTVTGLPGLCLGVTPNAESCHPVNKVSEKWADPFHS